MTESVQTPAPVADNGRWKTLAIILTLVNSLLVAVIAGLQADASIRASQSNRDSQYYALLTSQELARQGAQTAYEGATFSQALAYEQEALIAQFTALQLEQDGNTSSSDSLVLQASVASARAEAAKELSIYYTDPRYAPKKDGEIPNLQAYLDDAANAGTELVLKQNAAADAYQRWNSKSDSYITILTLLSLAFFLLGISQSLRPGLRLVFAMLGLGDILIGCAWAVIVLVL